MGNKCCCDQADTRIIMEKCFGKDKQLDKYEYEQPDPDDKDEIETRTVFSRQINRYFEEPMAPQDIEEKEITEAILADNDQKLKDTGVNITDKEKKEYKLIKEEFKRCNVDLVFTKEKKRSDLDTIGLLQVNQVQKLSISIDDKFENYQNDKKNYEGKAIESISKALKVKPELIQILSVTAGSVQMDFAIKLEKMNERNVKQERVAQTDAEIKSEIEKTFGKPLNRATLKTEKSFKLSLNDFNPKHDRKMTGQKFENWAGGETYIQPPSGWMGKALNVGPDDQEWLGNDENAWPVAYHGVGGDLDFVLPKIVKGGLRPGWRHAYTDKPAIYCTPDFNTALSYAQQGSCSSFGDTKMIVQCRINKKSDGFQRHNDQVWTVTDSKDIKPYRIIIQE